MATRADDTLVGWKLGETWSEIITCTDSNGNALNPIAATWTLKDMAGNTVLTRTASAGGITLVGNVATVNLPTSVQGPVAPKIYWREMVVTAPNGALSRQVDGHVAVLPG